MQSHVAAGPSLPFSAWGLRHLPGVSRGYEELNRGVVWSSVHMGQRWGGQLQEDQEAVVAVSRWERYGDKG